MLNAEGYDYTDDTLIAGLHLVLHTPQDPPRLIGYDSDSIILTAGTQNFISVRVRFLPLTLFTCLLTYLLTYLMIYFTLFSYYPVA